MSDALAVVSHPKPPIRRGFWIVLAVSLASLTASLFASEGVLMLCAFGGWLLALLTVVMAGWGLARGANDRLATRFSPTFATLLLLGQTSIAYQTGRLFGHVLDGRPVAMALLHGPGCAFRQYADTWGHYPDSVAELVRADVVHPKEPGGVHAAWAGRTEESFMWTPPACRDRVP